MGGVIYLFDLCSSFYIKQSVWPKQSSYINCYLKYYFYMYKKIYNKLNQSLKIMDRNTSYSKPLREHTSLLVSLYSKGFELGVILFVYIKSWQSLLNFAKVVDFGYWF